MGEHGAEMGVPPFLFDVKDCQVPVVLGIPSALQDFHFAAKSFKVAIAAAVDDAPAMMLDVSHDWLARLCAGSVKPRRQRVERARSLKLKKQLFA
jgi:hypothetical protein